MFGQTFAAPDLAVIALLVVLEGVLSIDNALVLGILAKRLPKHQQGKALTYGLIGAFVFRFIAIGTATFLLRWTWVKLLGGGYLIWIALKHFIFEQDNGHNPHDAEAVVQTPLNTENGEPIAPGPATEPVVPYGATRTVAKFWPTVFVIEMTDIAFAVDSILAAIGVVGSPPEGTPRDALHPKLWVVLIGGFLGVILMRYAAVLFIRLLEKFPRFETAAYLLVIVIGMKLLLDWAAHQWHFEHVVNFHDPRSMAFWAFWGVMVACFCVGFLPDRKRPPATDPTPAA